MMTRPRKVVYKVNNAGCGGGLLVPPEAGRPVAAFAVAEVFAEGFWAPVVAALSVSEPAPVAAAVSEASAVTEAAAAAAASEASAVTVAASAPTAPAAAIAVSVPVSPATAASA